MRQRQESSVCLLFAASATLVRVYLLVCWLPYTSRYVHSETWQTEVEISATKPLDEILALRDNIHHKELMSTARLTSAPTWFLDLELDHLPISLFRDIWLHPPPLLTLATRSCLLDRSVSACSASWDTTYARLCGTSIPGAVLILWSSCVEVVPLSKPFLAPIPPAPHLSYEVVFLEYCLVYFDISVVFLFNRWLLQVYYPCLGSMFKYFGYVATLLKVQMTIEGRIT